MHVYVELQQIWRPLALLMAASASSLSCSQHLLHRCLLQPGLWQLCSPGALVKEGSFRLRQGCVLCSSPMQQQQTAVEVSQPDITVMLQAAQSKSTWGTSLACLLSKLRFDCKRLWDAVMQRCSGRGH
jgi:hypothetical protein